MFKRSFVLLSAPSDCTYAAQSKRYCQGLSDCRLFNGDWPIRPCSSRFAGLRADHATSSPARRRWTTAVRCTRPERTEEGDKAPRLQLCEEAGCQRRLTDEYCTFLDVAEFTLAHCTLFEC